MAYQSGRETTDLFRASCQDYIDGIDYLGVSKYFAPINDYSVKELQELCDVGSNRKYLEEAIRGFSDSFEDYILSPRRRGISENGVIDIRFLLKNNGFRSNKTTLYCLFKLSFVIAFYQRLSIRYDNKPLEIKELTDLDKYSGLLYFRGQSNYEYRVSPSIIRNLKESVFLDDDFYYNILKGAAGLEDKFNDLIRRGNNRINRYSKYAFIQHSCSFSPLVDFTQSPVIALSFALSNASRINDFRSEDSSVFCLRGGEGELDTITDIHIARDFLIKAFRMKIIESKYFKFGKDYYLKKVGPSPVLINYILIDDLLDAMTPKIKVINIPTNDRMLYQQGLFVCFYDCLCLGDYIAYELNPNFVLTKIKIPKRNKRALLDSIYKKHREYDPEHLMNPYLYFNE